jgi:hypothetical protein
MTRRPMKYVAPDPATGTPVFVTTLCGTTGPRRLLRDTGEVSDGLRVFELAECVADPCVGVVCCASTIRRTLYLTISAAGTCLDGRVVTLTYSATSGKWEGALAFTCGSSGFDASFTFYCVPLGLSLAVEFVLTVEYRNFTPQCGITNAGIAHATGYQPGAIANYYTCDPFFATYSHGDSFPYFFGDPLGSGRCHEPGTNTPVTITVGTTPGGSGSGSGSGAGPCVPPATRGLMKFFGLDPATGFPVLAKACCPQSGSGSGSGGGVVTDCCPGAGLPTTLIATFTLRSGSCPALDGLSVPLAYDAGTGQWAGSFAAGGDAGSFTIACVGGFFSVTGGGNLVLPGGGGSLQSCAPFQYAITAVGWTPCPGALFDLTVTE